jgi:putative SOS response-associated peptidase YedK
MCTKAVAVNAREMSNRLNANVIISNNHGLGEAALVELLSKNDVLPTDLAPVITHNRPREIQYMRWGLIPAFVTDPKAISPMFNAKAETLAELRSFRDLIMASRCLILNEGFFENEKQGDERVQWKVSPAQEDYFYKAGLWTTWRNPNTLELVDSFTMITCDPKDTAFSKIHDRIPIIMTKAERRLWMNPQATKEQLLALLKPCDASMYTITEFSRKPLKAPKNNSKDNQGGFFN